MTSDAWRVVGYAIAVGILLLPIVLARWIIPSRAFQKRRRRIRWAGERLLWWRDPMSDLPPPFNEDPESRDRRRR